ncbi:hypothetical protein BGZ51_006001 [Haplosporangium sp. Z 767]|nr:hypothetical protein BGZ51_006001 [Haplosporangium sp. Z 767]
MVSLSRQLTETDSLYCNAGTNDSKSTKSAPSVKSAYSSTSSTASVRSGVNSTKSRSTTKSKSSTNSVPKSENWKASVDPLGMSTKAIKPGFMPMFDTHLYSPGFQMPSKTASGGPKAYQSKQLKFVEKKPGSGSSAASTKSGKSGRSGKSDKSEKTAVSSSDRSVKSSNSSTKSTLFSSFSGNSSQPGDSGNSNSSSKQQVKESADEAATKVKEIEATTKAKETEATTKAKETEGKAPTPSDSQPATAAPICEPTVVVEDHSSPDSLPSPSDKQVAAAIVAARRPSIAESISRLQTPRTQPTSNEILLKRVTTWEYLAHVHGGKAAYYNTIVLTEADLRRYYTPEAVQRRTYQFFLLGTSLANVLDIPHLSDYAKSLSAILQEFEHFLSVESKSMMSFFKGGRKVTDGWSFEETGEYTHIEIRTMPFEMDYTVVFATLCEMVALSYKKFDTHKSSIITNSDVFHKIDTRFKKISNNAARELEALVREAMQEELNSLDPIGGLMGDWDQQVASSGY